MAQEKKIFAEFPPVSTKEWEDVISRDLKGADYKKKLLWKTGEGVDLLPFYRSEDREHADEPLVSDGNQWKVCQRIYGDTLDNANQTAQTAIKGGADALQLNMHLQSITGAIGPDIRGTAIQTQQDFSRLFKNIPLTEIDIYFDTGMMAPILMAMLVNACEQQQIDTAKITGSFLFDPFAFTLKHGRLPNDEERLTTTARQMIACCSKTLPNMHSLGIDARIYHKAGATITQELGYALAAGNEYLATIPNQKIARKIVASSIHFKVAIGADYFLEIAKFRAIQKLWAVILQTYGLDEAEIKIHAATGTWNKTRREPYVNMLRTTTEGMAAALGGCDSITINPFDASFRQPDDFSQRIARNAQIILKEEAYFNKVADPAAGSWYIETLTDKIAAAAWNIFQEIEQQGGLMQAIKNGFIQTAIAKSRKVRNEAIAKNEHIFVGANKYINEEEHPERNGSPAGYQTISMKKTKNSADIDPQNLISSTRNALRDEAAIGDIVPALFDINNLKIEPLPEYRAEELINKQNTDGAD